MHGQIIYAWILISSQAHLYKFFWVIVTFHRISEDTEFVLVLSLKLEANGMKYNSNLKEKLDPYLEFQQKQEPGGAFKENNVIHFYE